MPSWKESMSILVSLVDDSSLLALSQAVRSCRSALWSLRTPILLYLRMNSRRKCFTISLSKSAPPRWVSPAMAFTSNRPMSMSTPGSMLRRETVQGASAEVEDEHRPPPAFPQHAIKTVCDGGGGGLVDDAHDVQPGDGAGVHGCLALRVVEVDGDGDDGVLHHRLEVHLCDLLHLCQHHGGDLLRGELLLTFVLHHYHRPVFATRDDFERPQLDVFLDGLIAKSAADQSLHICKEIINDINQSG
ncbi:hypothetical protein U9M48_035213 [Paspalum notatum var. saurae]|uniref:Uncharacterized protein n=1 Tax=Paspalum notatum var. saurae TaxID=547442 RepID=A0AAQ3UAV0_PASNO